jgi:kumamolisin
MALTHLLGRRVITTIGVLLILSLALSIPAAANQLQQSAILGASACSGVPNGWVVLTGNRPPIMQIAHLLHPTDPTQQMSLSISFRLRNQAELDELLREQQDPNSPNYLKPITPQEFQARFGPTTDMIAQVSEFLTLHHLRVTKTQGQEIQFSGSVRQVECAFAVQINDYQIDNQTGFGPASDPAVPSGIAPYIAAVIGLNNFSRPIIPGFFTA